MTHFTAKPASNEEVLSLRTRYREEMNCQIVHDSIHRRTGWTRSWLLLAGGRAVGFGSIAIAGPWKEKPTLFEFYVLPEARTQAFHLFDALVVASEARFMEIQSNDSLLAVMFHTFARDIVSEKIVFHAGQTTQLAIEGATLRCLTSDEAIRQSIQARQGGPEWELLLDDAVVGKGGILFHYNIPYGDVFMDINEPARRRGLGAYLVQELKRLANEMGAIPAARCSPDNIASRRTLQKAGMVPFAHMLAGVIAQPEPPNAQSEPRP
jgi:GNAT superfamily N-acetyltransferase